jgi:hypothetical protein
VTPILGTTDQLGCMRYRQAYGEAFNLFEASKYDHNFGLTFAGRVGDHRGGLHGPE